MTETKKMMNWGAPALETRSDDIAAATKVNTVLLPEEAGFNWDLMTFLFSSQEFVPVPSPSPPSPSLPHVEDFKQRQREELKKCLRKHEEPEQAVLLQQQQREQEARRKRQEEEHAADKKQGLGDKEEIESQTMTVLLDILTELTSLKQRYETYIIRPRRKRPSRAKQLVRYCNGTIVGRICAIFTWFVNWYYCCFFLNCWIHYQKSINY